MLPCHVQVEQLEKLWEDGMGGLPKQNTLLAEQEGAVMELLLPPVLSPKP